ncbi:MULTISPECIES: PhzF family phenazine biosynthesis protein [unclassified Ruegeria]|nr:MULTISPECIES: PhzF family phenazine biosynthesis protein [unclassified Ruegeria]NOD35538.1 PhzF family phenazine biosynthesis isomerase [Ruegeria sp. HKCCD7296]NOD49382.1 PhzF family phenazine biosynthesis isomerase [Ruegeria sp. HKCCD5849]NOD53319.1 PhzF family phenazine biosynthesis isomerase [Ruegeria sp. HKCCD5851]NOD69643.1 PhzF family phenazine biosynthesis isomerase [Ruegeria sp. HKCCD7303]NOE35608.1 PhzF family phenazine biosynthesis isomerase [Ruegeria sp. HKCCD7318]
MNTQANTARQATVEVVHGFVDGGTGGNPAGVILDADELSEQDMQDIAARVGLSETAFVSRSETEGFKLDFFTPNRRIAHCGHATIAAFSHLDALGRIPNPDTSKETVDGPRRILMKEGAAYMEQLAPRYSGVEEWAKKGVKIDDVLNSLGIDNSQIDRRFPPLLVNTGNSFIVVGLSNARALANVKPDYAKITQISEQLDLIGYYVFTNDPLATSRDATTRMFAPRYAIEEEAATGMAAGPLACVLHDFGDSSQRSFQIEQGVFMNPASPSLIKVELEVEDGAISGLMAGGYGKVARSLQIAF